MHADMEQLIDAYTSSTTVHVASAQCSTESHADGTGKPLCSYYNLGYYPFLVYGESGTKQGEYDGDRSFSAMKQFIDSNFQEVDRIDSHHEVCPASTIV